MASAPDARTRVTAWLTGGTAPVSPAWLARQRWFGGKSRTIERLAVADVAWIGHGPDALALLEVHYAPDALHGAGAERYAVLLARGRDGGPAAIGRVDGTTVIEAATDAGAIRQVVAAMIEGAPLASERGGAVVPADVTAGARRDLAAGAAPLTVKAVGQEQSNTSVRVGRGHVFKLIRRLHDGEHPQLELGRFLSRAGFHAAPPLHGSLTYRAPDGGRYAVGALEGWVDNDGDGWSYVLATLEGAASRGSLSPLGADLQRLGATTAAFHVALASDSASPAFAPERVSPAEVDRWRGYVQAQIDRLLQLIDRDQARWPAPAAAIARAILDRRQGLARSIPPLDLGGGLDALRTIRVHGDFHLGQTLKTAGGFTLIDFEGEPAKPLAERRQKHCALRDVAGMLRSLDYAAATVGARIPAALGAAAALQNAFLEGYFADGRLRALLPSRDACAPLLRLFELEKAIYEVEYELNNRPDWLHLPLGAVARHLDGPA
jgi:trehalose synthase-fused probable maltokinase